MDIFNTMGNDSFFGAVKPESMTIFSRATETCAQQVDYTQESVSYDAVCAQWSV